MIRRLATAALLALAACSPAPGKPPAAAPAASGAPLTQRQRDSAIGASGIPGARGGTSALHAASSLDARTRAADTVGSAP